MGRNLHAVCGPSGVEWVEFTAVSGGLAVAVGAHGATVADDNGPLGNLALRDGYLAAWGGQWPNHEEIAAAPPEWVGAVFEALTREPAAQAGRVDAQTDGTPVWVWYDRDGVSFGSFLADAIVEEVARTRLGASAVRLDGENNGRLCYAAAAAPLPYATPSPAARPSGCCWNCGAVAGDSVAGGRVFFEPDPDDRGGGYVVEQQICQAADCRRASAIRRRRAGRDPLPKTDGRGRTTS